MSATPRKISRPIYLTVLDDDTLETVVAKTTELITRVTREGFDTAKADDGYAVRFVCERMETQEEADARENDPREIERTLVAKTRRELDRIARKYSLSELEAL